MGDEKYIFDHKSLISAGCGDQALISKLHTFVKQGLPRESVEWKRSYGRPVRNINVDANFVPYQADLVPGEDNWILLGRTFFHIFWTDCDIDTYKASVKDEISEWLSTLKSKNVSDWLIVTVVHDESKVKTKILRTSVMDKVKNDFCSKQQDRCTMLQEPFKPDSKSSESWNKLYILMRQLILQSFNNNLNRFEEHMRLQREKRQEIGWTFNHYFLLQEELAFMFEMLGLYEDALVQYDELDALFTQFVLNHFAGDTADWLQNYQDNIPSRWDSIQLSRPIDFSKRTLIRTCKDSLLDFRNYLFLRQSTLLFLMFKPWEVAERVVPFMHNCLQELNILQLQLPMGGAACWVFLTCLEVVKTCESFTTAGKMDAYSLHMAVLWDYARKKLFELGQLIQIVASSDKTLPESVDTFLQGVKTEDGDKDTEALIKLREALSSKSSFTKHYLELSELAMGTYKHIGRMRSAKLICKDLADFYIKLGDYKKAESFLLDALKVFIQEGWTMLADDIRIDLAHCQKQQDQQEKYIRTCVHLSASPTLCEEKRKFYQKEMMEASQEAASSPIYIPTKPILMIPHIQPENNTFLVTETSLINVTIHLATAEPIHCKEITAALAYRSADMAISAIPDRVDGGSLRRHKRNLSGTSYGSFGSIASVGSIDVVNSILGQSNCKLPPQSVDLLGHYEYTPNKKTVLSSGLKSKTNLKRLDSGPKVIIEKDVEKGDYSMCVRSGEVTILPGENKVTLEANLDEAGMYTVTQLCLCVSGVEFLRNIPVEAVTFHVLCHQPQLKLCCDKDPLYAGVCETLVLELSGGTEGIANSTKLYVTHPQPLKVTAQPLKNGCIDLEPFTSGEVREITVTMISQIQLDRTDALEHQICAEWRDMEVSSDQVLYFNQPLKIHHKLHTAGTRKFIQCVVQSICDLTFDLVTPCMTCDCNDVDVISLNKADRTLVINDNQNASYMWELKTNIANVDMEFQCDFSVQYKQPQQPTTFKQCGYQFMLSNYRTLYKIESSITLPESEKCAFKDTDCDFSFNVMTLNSGEDTSLAYDITCDKDMWTCTGQKQGVVKPDGDVFSHHLHACPGTEGYLPHPHIKLYIIKQGWSKAIESNTTQGVPLDIEDLLEQGILKAMSTGQVYYASLAQRLHVQPESHKELLYGRTDKMTSMSSKSKLQVVEVGPL